jgi:hypothetical protein
LKLLGREKRSSLFSPVVSKTKKEFYKIDSMLLNFERT